MADEDVKGTSADAEEPTEHEQVETPAEEAAETPKETVAEAAEEVAAEEPAAEAEEAPAAEAAETEPAAEAGADEPAADEPAAEAEEAPAAETAEGEEPAVAAAPTTGPKPKRKRLPRALRPKKTRPQRARSSERKPMVRLEKPEHERGRRQERQGKVVSDAMEKTIVVEVSVVKAHPKYKKVVRRSVKFHAHDERSEAKVGDLVRIVETRPLSRTKRWRLVEVLEAAK
jgi:small subunit ribosomal protein S17